jgi:hypothetical protein
MPQQEQFDDYGISTRRPPLAPTYRWLNLPDEPTEQERYLRSLARTVDEAINDLARSSQYETTPSVYRAQVAALYERKRVLIAAFNPHNDMKNIKGPKRLGTPTSSCGWMKG